MSDNTNNLSYIFIDKLILDASIGVFDWEKKIKQRLIFDLELSCDFSKAKLTDDIQDAVNYALVCDEIEKLLAQKHYQLLEFLAEKICSHLFDCFNISTIKLSISKPDAVPKATSVGVKIVRSRNVKKSN